MMARRRWRYDDIFRSVSRHGRISHELRMLGARHFATMRHFSPHISLEFRCLFLARLVSHYYFLA